MSKRLGVVHTTESHESYTGDISVANYLRQRGIPVHWVVDGNSSVKMLEMSAPCSAAKGLPRADGFHIEHVGTAHQTAPEWGDDFSEAMLNISAAHMAEFVVEYDIPIVHVTGADVRNGRGICGHIDVTEAYGIRGGHWDPGPNFPWDHYLAKVRYFADSIRGVPSEPHPTYIPAPSEEDSPMIIRFHHDGSFWLYDGILRKHIPSPGHVKRLKELGVPEHDVSKNPIDSQILLDVTEDIGQVDELDERV